MVQGTGRGFEDHRLGWSGQGFKDHRLGSGWDKHGLVLKFFWRVLGLHNQNT